MQSLRDPENGCPWDLKQDHLSLMPYFHEELSEFEEALLEKGIQAPETISELGDLLFQIVFHAQLLEEKKLSSLDDLALKCAEKLIHRHPHVFDKNADKLTEQEIRQNWEKQKEKESPPSQSETPVSEHIAKVPKHLNPLLRAQRLGDRAASFGFDWPNSESVLVKVAEEYQEFKVEDNESLKQEELGDLLFTLCQYARKKEWSVDSILKKSNQKFLNRFKSMEKSLNLSAKTLENLSASDWEKEWQKAKLSEK